MTVEVVHFPAGVYPSVQRLVPDVGQGQQLSESPFVGAQAVQTWRGAERWRLELQFDDLTGADRADMMAFVTRLRVSHNVFLIVNHTKPSRGDVFGPTFSMPGSSELFGAASGGLAHMRVWWKGFGVSAVSTSPLKAGDFFSVNSELKMSLVDIPPLDASGVGSIYFWPPLFSTVTSGTRVDVGSPCGGFRMLQASQLTTDPPGYRTSLTITAVERVNSAMVAEFL